MANIGRNIKLFYIHEFFRSMIFHIPVWVSYELQFITFSQLTFIEAFIFAFQIILELPTGAFADLVGRRSSIALGHFLEVIAVIIYGFSTNFSHFLIYAALGGAAEALISGAKEALVYDSLKEMGKEKDFTKINGKLGVIFQFGIAAATLIGGVLAKIDLRIPIFLYAVAHLASAIISSLYVEPSIDSEKFTLSSYINQTKQGVKEILKNAHIKQVSLFYIFVGAISWSCMMVFNTTVLVQIGYSEFEVGVAYATIRIINSVLLFKILCNESLFTRSRIYYFFPALLMFSLLPGYWMSKSMAVIFVAGSMLASSARWAILSKYTNDEFSSKNRATAISTLSMAIGMLCILIIAASGPLVEWAGSSGIVFTLLGIVAAITVLPLGTVLARQHVLYQHAKAKGNLAIAVDELQV